MNDEVKGAPSAPDPKASKLSSLQKAREAKAQADAARKVEAQRAAEQKAPPPVDLRMVSNAYAGLWLVLKLFVWWFAKDSHTLDDLSTTEIDTDAKLLLPLVERHPSLARLLSWIGAPIVIVRRVSEKLHRKPKVDPAESKPEAAA